MWLSKLFSVLLRLFIYVIMCNNLIGAKINKIWFWIIFRNFGWNFLFFFQSKNLTHFEIFFFWTQALQLDALRIISLGQLTLAILWKLEWEIWKDYGRQSEVEIRKKVTTVSELEYLQVVEWRRRVKSGAQKEVLDRYRPIIMLVVLTRKGSE